jgi:hypothetical protein
MLLGADDLPLEGSGIDGMARFGMPKEHMWCVSPGGLGGPTNRSDSVAGDFDPALLSRTAQVAIVVYSENKPLDIPGLIALVKQVAQIGAAIGALAAGSE